MSRVLINNIIRELNEIQEGSLWFDQSFKEKLDLLPEEIAFAKPLPQVHCVAEHVAHMLAWRKECLLRYNGQRTELMNGPEDWKDNESLRKTGWNHLKQALYDSRIDLIKLFDGKDDTYLDTPFPDTEYNNHYLIEGILQHDIYHLGQIGVTIKLLNEQKVTNI